jgi:DNA invertase Pin-like site-specific DNA recombinase
MKVVTYSRGRTPLSVDDQKRTLHDYAEARGIEVVAEFEDTAPGGTLDPEPAMVASALEVIRAGFAESLLVCSRDRISRDPQRVVSVEATLREMGGRLLTVE